MQSCISVSFTHCTQHTVLQKQRLHSAQLPAAALKCPHNVSEQHTSCRLHSQPAVKGWSRKRKARTLTSCSATNLDGQAQVHSDIDAAVLRELWDSVPRPLLRIGNSGVQDSHRRSLVELAQSHGLVKVQVNGDPAAVPELGKQLSADAELVQVKGNTMLFGPLHTPLATMLAAARSKTGAARDVKDKKQSDRAKKLVAGELSIDVALKARLRSLVDAGVIRTTDFDTASISALCELPMENALALLDDLQKTRQEFRRVKNKSAWLTSQCRREMFKQA